MPDEQMERAQVMGVDHPGGNYLMSYSMAHLKVSC
jgi:hypothetical protein